MGIEDRVSVGASMSTAHRAHVNAGTAACSGTARTPLSLLAAAATLMVLAHPRPGGASVASTTLQELAGVSQSICVACTDALETVAGMKLAAATVRQPLRGLAAGERI